MASNKEIDKKNIPSHIAIIMDGNRRWAKKRLLMKNAGHAAGAMALKKLASEAQKMGIKYLSVYAFSTENWKRPQEEIDALMNLLRSYIQQYLDDLKNNNMKIIVIGERSVLPKDLIDKINMLEQLTAEKQGLCLVIALNYGARNEITRAAKKMCEDILSGKISIESVEDGTISSYLDTKNIPDPQLLIRTSGEIRISNFLLWQLAYTEFYFTDKLWPDFKIADLKDAILYYQKRERRFGGDEE